MIEYELRAPDGALVATHVRVDDPDGKRFYFRSSDGSLGLDGLATADLPLWPIDRGVRRSTLLVEGEKAADALLGADIAALGTVTGAHGTPSEAVLAELTGVRVYLWPDNDDVGRSHMERVAERLRSIAASVLWIEPPADRPKGWDAADAIAELGVEAVQKMIRNARDFLSAEGDVPSGGKDELTFLTARQLAAETPPQTEWAVEGLLAVAALHELTGKAKTAGKTTFTLAMIRCALEGQPFIGRHTQRTPVVFLSEQTPTSLRDTLSAAGLLERDDLHILLWRDATAASWPTIVEAAVAKCFLTGSRLLVIDTLPQFAGMRGESENDAGAALEAVRPLQAAAARGLAVLVIRHDRKGEAAIGESARGSSAFTGAVDVVIRLSRKPDAQRPTIRELSVLSRFHGWPESELIELTDDGYIALGSEQAVALAAARSAILDALPSHTGLTLDEIVPTIVERRTTAQAALTALVEEGRVSKLGMGRKGAPFRYSLTNSDAAGFLSAAPIGAADRKGIPAVATAPDLMAQVQAVFADVLAPAIPTDTSAVVRP